MSQSANSSHGTELAEIAQTRAPQSAARPSIMSQQVRQRDRVMDAGSLPDDSSRSLEAWPLPRVWRQRTRVSDVARREETGMRARMSF